MSDSYVQWSYDLVRNSYLNRETEANSKDELYLHYLEPFSKEFFSINHPVLLFGGQDFRLIPEETHLTLRDGLLPLSIFFKEMKPNDVNSEIVIHKDLWIIVPEEWRSKVKYYDVQSNTVFSKTNLPQKIIITGILNSTLADPQEFEEKLSFLANVLGQDNIKKIEVISYFPDKRNDLWGSWDEDNVLRYAKAIFKNIKLDILTPDWKNLMDEQDFKGCLYYEVNAGLFIKDSFPQNMFLSRGAGLLEKPVNDDLFIKKGEFKASLYHKYVLYSLDAKKAGEFKNPLVTPGLAHFKRMAEFDSNRPKLNFVWEKWYASYVKKVMKKFMSKDKLDTAD